MALEQQQELEPKTLEQQLKDNEACGYEKGAMGILSQAIKGARRQKTDKIVVIEQIVTKGANG